MTRLKNLSLAGLLTFSANLVQADLVVIVSARSPVAALDKAQVSGLFLGKSSTYPGGTQAVPIDQSEGGALRDEFHDKITGKSAAQLKSYWSKLVFSGKATPPKEVPNSVEVKKLIAANPNMIGYIEKTGVDASVKVVFTP